jgi:hypothetical protein
MKAVVPPADFVVVVWEKQCHGCDDDGAAKFTAIEVTQQLKLLQLKLRMVSAQDASMYFDGEDPVELMMPTELPTTPRTI